MRATVSLQWNVAGPRVTDGLEAAAMPDDEDRGQTSRGA